MLPFVESRLQWMQTLPLLVPLLKSHSGVNSLISDKLERSKVDSHMYILILRTIVVYRWLPWKHWTFRMIFPQSLLMISKSLCAGVWRDFNARRYWIVSLSWTCWRTTETAAQFYPSSWKRYWTHCIGWTNVVGCSWQVWCCWKECVKMDNFALQHFINRISLLKLHYLVRFLQTLFQLLKMTVLLLSKLNSAKGRVNIGSWLQTFDTNFFLQIVVDVRSKVLSTTSTTSRWCQHPDSLNQVYAAFIQYMQLFIFPSFHRKKL